jgi:putative redox protein
VRTPTDAGRARRGNPEAVSLTATARSIPGTLRQEVLVDGRHRIFTDEPQRLGGEDSAPAPHELFPAALASCISTTLIMYARTKEWDLGDVSVVVNYDNAASPRRFDVVIELGGNLTDDQIARLEKVAATCPVRRALEGRVEFVETIEREP